MPTTWPKENWRAMPIDEMELSTRTYNALRYAGLLTAGDIADCDDAEMLRTPNFGRKSLNEVRALLSDYFGLSTADRRDLVWQEKVAAENIEALERRLANARAQLARVQALRGM